MIISRTPLRISFAGGGSDLRAFYAHEPGAVLSTTIDKYIYITVNPKFDRQIRASYAITEIVDHVADLQHELIREGLRVVGIDGGIEITSISDVPSRGTGLGSSSSYTVGLLHALYAHKGRYVGAARLASEACAIEIERCAKPIGKQDQYIAAFGGLQLIQFNPDESVFVNPIVCRADTKRRLEQRLLLLYTGLARSADDLLAEQQSNTSQAKTRDALRSMTRLAFDLRTALCADDVDSFGEMLHEGWLLKRGLASGITSSVIDDWYAAARRVGARGGKLLGAGGGGFLLLDAPPDQHAAICAALPQLRPVPFGFEPQGSKIIYVEEGRDR
ncbi:MAG: GHMP kinase [Chloroflexota bacterium]|nr:GHMP kinase [Chloroflexota bacterium]